MSEDKKTPTGGTVDAEGTGSKPGRGTPAEYWEAEYIARPKTKGDRPIVQQPAAQMAEQPPDVQEPLAQTEQPPAELAGRMMHRPPNDGRLCVDCQHIRGETATWCRLQSVAVDKDELCRLSNPEHPLFFLYQSPPFDKDEQPPADPPPPMCRNCQSWQSRDDIVGRCVESDDQTAGMDTCRMVPSRFKAIANPWADFPGGQQPPELHPPGFANIFWLCFSCDYEWTTTTDQQHCPKCSEGLISPYRMKIERFCARAQKWAQTEQPPSLGLVDCCYHCAHEQLCQEWRRREYKVVLTDDALLRACEFDPPLFTPKTLDPNATHRPTCCVRENPEAQHLGDVGKPDIDEIAERLGPPYTDLRDALRKSRASLDASTKAFDEGGFDGLAKHIEQRKHDQADDDDDQADEEQET